MTPALRTHRRQRRRLQNPQKRVMPRSGQSSKPAGIISQHLSSVAQDAYLVQRGKGKTLIAGYPWFGDWGRDTFIALRGLCIATGHLEEARDILLQWAGTVSEGMLPNRFPDQGEQPEFNSVDASLWYIIAVNDYLLAATKHPSLTDDCHTKELRAAVEAILAGYNEGTRFGIRADRDGLLSAGEHGQQLTWMDARVDGQIGRAHV